MSKIPYLTNTWIRQVCLPGNITARMEQERFSCRSQGLVGVIVCYVGNSTRMASGLSDSIVNSQTTALQVPTLVGGKYS